jgi:hypothetical protein
VPTSDPIEFTWQFIQGDTDMSHHCADRRSTLADATEVRAWTPDAHLIVSLVPDDDGNRVWTIDGSYDQLPDDIYDWGFRTPDDAIAHLSALRGVTYRETDPLA